MKPATKKTSKPRVGRRPSDNPAIHHFHIRLNGNEKARLRHMFDTSEMNNISLETYFGVTRSV